MDGFLNIVGKKTAKSTVFILGNPNNAANLMQQGENPDFFPNDFKISPQRENHPK